MDALFANEGKYTERGRNIRLFDYVASDGFNFQVEKARAAGLAK